jgi:bifunctional DNA-binding transcriptional regulator/antitoxin component of YhaV-PrlF toxin-antitoxin module
MRFRTTIKASGKNTAGIPIPEEVVEALGAGRKPPVVVTVNGFTYRSSVATVDGQPMVGLSAERRAASGVNAGDEVEVEIEVDSVPREVTVPPQLASALDSDPAAKATWDRLSYSNRSWHVLQIDGAKTEETRERRIAKSIEALREGRVR